MRWNTASRQIRLYLIGALILLIGLGSAIAIYLTAENAPESALIQDLENSKSYIHDLELYGGKLNVLADQFRRWFESLWQGKSLAFTVGWIAMVVACGCFFVAYHLPSASEPDDRGEDQR